eukprot:sb/3461206/
MISTLSSRYEDALDHHKAQLILATDVKSRKQARLALGSIGHCYTALGDLEQALTCHQQCVDLATEAGDKVSVAQEYGSLSQELGLLEEALSAHKKHLVKALEMRDRAAEGRVYGNLGNIHCAMGHFNKAIKLHHQALSIAVEEGDTVSQALTNGNLGIAFQSLGDTTVFTNVKGGLEHNKPLAGDVQSQCKALHSIAEVHRVQGCPSLAIPYLEQAVSLSGTKERLLAKNLSSLATVYLATGQFTEAKRRLETTPLGPEDRFTVLGDLALACLFTGHLSAARHHFTSLVTRSTHNAVDGHAGLGRLALRAGAYSEAKEHFESALTLSREGGLIRKEFSLLLLLSRALSSLHLYEDAFSALTSASDLLPSDQKPLLAQLCGAFGELSLVKGDYGDSLRHYQRQVKLLRGEERVRAEFSVARCLWLEGRTRDSMDLLGSLAPATQQLKCEVLALRCTILQRCGLRNRAVDVAEQHLSLSLGNKMLELGALASVSALYERLDMCEEALVHYDQYLMAARELEDLPATCAGLLGVARSYCHLSDQDTTLQHCNELDSLVNGEGEEGTESFSLPRTCGENLLVRSRALLALGQTDQAEQCSRECVEVCVYEPVTLALAHSILAQCLWERGVCGVERMAEVCSRVEGLVLQRSLEVCLEDLGGVQERSYEALFDLQDSSINKLWVNEGDEVGGDRYRNDEVLKRELYTAAPYPDLMLKENKKSKLCNLLGETLTNTIGTVYLIESGEGDAMFSFIKEQWPSLSISRCDCLVDLTATSTEKCRIPCVVAGTVDSEYKHEAEDIISDDCVELSAEEVSVRSGNFHCLHIPSSILSTSSLGDPVFTSDVGCDCVFIYYDKGSVEPVAGLCRALLSGGTVQCVVAVEGDLTPDSLHTYSSRIENGAFQVSPDALCFGMDWTLRVADWRVGLRLVLRTTPDIPTPAAAQSILESRCYKHCYQFYLKRIALLTVLHVVQAVLPKDFKHAPKFYNVTYRTVELLFISLHLLQSLHPLQSLHHPHRSVVEPVAGLCRALLSGGTVQCVVAVEGHLTPDSLHTYSSRIENGTFQVYPDGALCFGVDWTLRVADWRAGLRLVLRTTPDIPTPETAQSILESMDRGKRSDLHSSALGIEEIQGESARSLLLLLSQNPHLDLSEVEREDVLLGTLLQLRKEGRAVVQRDTYQHAFSFLQSFEEMKQSSFGVFKDGPFMPEITEDLFDPLYVLVRYVHYADPSYML